MICKMTKTARGAAVRRALAGLSLLVLAGCGGAATGEGAAADAAAAPLRIGYSDWPGWVAWEVAREHGLFEANGVAVELIWMDYVPSMDAFAAGALDAVAMTNGDALVSGATAQKPSTAILVNDYSFGNDMIVARDGISGMRDLVGRRVGVEIGFVDHLLLLHALDAAGIDPGEVELVNIPTNEAPQARRHRRQRPIGMTAETQMERAPRGRSFGLPLEGRPLHSYGGGGRCAFR